MIMPGGVDDEKRHAKDTCDERHGGRKEGATVWRLVNSEGKNKEEKEGH